MSLGNEAARGWDVVAQKTGGTLLEVASVGLATVVLATGANAQQASELPTLEVTTKAETKPKKKKAAAKKQAAPAPVDVEPVVPVQAEAPIGNVDGQGNNLTPESGNTLQSGTGMGRLPGTLQSTPQTVNVVSQQQMQEQQITTLDQALRNVPGVTVSLGEGGQGTNGDQFRVRGFLAKDDVYIDGLRDFGVYVRDSFAYEEVQVYKGPTSETFGQGTTGGAINIRQKKAHLGDKTKVEGSIGTASMYRTTADVNKQIDATTAIRLNLMYHEQEFDKRDHVYSDRWGFAASLGFGLGTKETWHLNYLYQHNDRLPDVGVPMVGRAITPDTFEVGKPVTEMGVARNKYYGTDLDRDKADSHLITSLYRNELNSWLTLSNDTRLAFYDRSYANTVVNCSEPGNTTCSDNFFAGDPTATVPLGGGSAANPGYNQDTWSFQNITTLAADFETGRFRHEAVAGIDVYHVENDRTQLTVVGGNKPAQNIWNPTFHVPGRYLAERTNNTILSEATNVGLFASDRMWFNEQWSILAGVRWDHYSAESQQWTTSWSDPNKATSNLVTPKASLIWEPTKSQTYYATWARSELPYGASITNTGSGLPVGAADRDPETGTLYEVGLKYSLFGDRLGLTAALFHMEKANLTQDDGSGNIEPLGEEQRVRGVELGVTGQLTPAWNVQLAYAYMDSANTEVEPDQRHLLGKPVDHVPENVFAFWTTYDLTYDLLDLPGKLMVGGGVRYIDSYASYRWTRTPAPSYEVPSYLSLDAVVSYEIDGYKMAVNGFNLTDELNYEGAITNRALVAPGRSFVFSLSKEF